ncbi:MAG: flavin reductase family protein [Undibacterium sp.]|nr:flavin reductase family protein [Undibacterium sp.]
MPTSALLPNFDSRHFRQSLGQFATGVTVIATRLPDGSFLGLTASSFNAVSLDPPLVLWSLGNSAQSMPIFTDNTHYIVNVLAHDQQHLAKQFASKIDNRFHEVNFTLSATGQPILQGVSAWFECFNRSRYPEGDHTIFVGEVEQCHFTPHAPLIYHGGQYLK